MTSNVNFDALDDTRVYSVTLFRHLFSGWTNISMDRNLSNLAHAAIHMRRFCFPHNAADVILNCSVRWAPRCTYMAENTSAAGLHEYAKLKPARVRTHGDVRRVETIHRARSQLASVGDRSLFVSTLWCAQVVAAADRLA
jgi:hypothetical protein